VNAQRRSSSEQEVVPVWEKRLTLWIITGLVGFIAVMAVDMRTQLSVIQANFNNALKTIEVHATVLKEHDNMLNNHDRRLIKIETSRTSIRRGFEKAGS
jgi:hypothetical protein